VKLLLDENLSPKLIELVGDLYPESLHIEHCGLSEASDDEVWKYAVANGFAIVSKDSDFSDRSALHGSPPKVIWLRIGNCTTVRAASVLRDAFPLIETFLNSAKETCLVLSVAAKKPVHRVE
jgi:predicted nuclease of predicted toxin-antitoxin system